MLVARVIIDVATRELDAPFDYLVPEGLEGVVVGSCVLVDFANRPAVGYVVEMTGESAFDRLKPVLSVLGGPYFDAAGAATAAWIAEYYVCPLSEAVRLFTPPGGTPRAVKVASADGEHWTLRRAGVGPVDDRWAMLGEGAAEFTPATRATTQRALLDALRAGPVRVAELAADLGSVDGALKRLAEAGAVRMERRRRHRDARVRERTAPRPLALTAGQQDALTAIFSAMERHSGDVLLLDGVTSSGKTEVYLQAIEEALERGGTACVLVPEISLTPQTVG
ncbi:MAG TPA: DEAD/DEAH box helicase, partial [Coriobacteriia bacterium]